MKENCLIEIGCEELPAGKVDAISAQIVELVKLCLQKKIIDFDNIEEYSTPRRIAFIVKNIDKKTKERTIKKHGPYLEYAYDKNNNPTKAATGFAASCGVDFSELTTIQDSKGSRVYFERVEPGQYVEDKILGWIETEVISKLQGFKTMRWGKPGNFIRPVQWITGLMGERVLKGSLFNIPASNISYGHRFLSKGPLIINSSDDYLTIMRDNFVEPCPKKRRSEIIKQLESLSLNTILDNNLLAEVVQLVEFPEVLVGRFSKSFLELPQEVLKAVLQKHQRNFLIDGENRYIIVSNIKSKLPERVISGNNHVVNARLSDAEFFYKNDILSPLIKHAEKLNNMTYHSKIGSMQEKITRLKGYALKLSDKMGVDENYLLESVRLCKADLSCELVNELPEIQGKFARHLAVMNGVNPEIASAIEEHREQLPSTQLGIALALIDQLDHIVEFAKIDLMPSGDKDPFGIRRSANAVLNCLINHNLNINLFGLLEDMTNDSLIANKVNQIVVERFNFWCKKQNIRLTLLTAIAPIKDSGDIKRISEVLLKLSATKNLDKLVASYKRLQNITKSANIEVQDIISLVEKEELDLLRGYNEFERGSPESELNQLLLISDKVDLMLDNIFVNTENKSLKNQRLLLIKQVKDLYLRIADFSKIS